MRGAPSPEAGGAVFHALGDPTRRHILVLLRDGERSVNELAGAFDVTRPAVSQHLKVLRDAELVADRKEGRTRFYRLVPEGLREAMDWFAWFDAFWDDRLTRLGRYLEGQPADESPPQPDAPR